MEWLLVVSIYASLASGFSRQYGFPTEADCLRAGRELKEQMRENTGVRMEWSCKRARLEATR